MEVILEPKVEIIARSEYIGHTEYLIPDDGDNAVKIGAFAAKGCYDSYGENGRANVENQSAILEHAHGSVLEHIHFSLFIEGITRGLSLELNRHRTFNISQRSTRYTKEEDASIVLDPYYAGLFMKWNIAYRRDSFFKCDRWMSDIPTTQLTAEDILEQKTIGVFLTDCEDAIAGYKRQIEYLEQLNPLNLTGFDLRKWARGKARSLLPHSLETRGTYTANIRGWRWFIEARSSRHAEPEIRVLADRVLAALRLQAPTYFADFELASTYDGINEWVPKYHKV